jgi:hypothetical protein
MAFNLFDELSDPKSRSCCDITLHQGDVLAVLMITKVDLQQAASDQPAGDQDRGEEKVIAY